MFEKARGKTRGIFALFSIEEFIRDRMKGLEGAGATARLPYKRKCFNTSLRETTLAEIVLYL